MLFGALIILVTACGQQETTTETKDTAYLAERGITDESYRQLQVELLLANSGKPYLVIDSLKHEFRLELKGGTVWEQPLTIDGDTAKSQLASFIKAFVGKHHRPARGIEGKYLFEASPKTPDSVLAIVGEVVKVDPALLQREIPERFQIEWDDDLKLIITTDVEGKPLSNFKNVLVKLADTFESPFSEKTLRVRMQAEAALTLYRLADKGLPTLGIVQ
jgi:hypothetical protein